MPRWIRQRHRAEQAHEVRGLLQEQRGRRGPARADGEGGAPARFPVVPRLAAGSIFVIRERESRGTLGGRRGVNGRHRWQLVGGWRCAVLCFPRVKS